MDDLNKITNNLIKSKYSMDSLIIYKNGSGYICNKKNDEKLNVRSVAKTVLSLAFGILMEKYPKDISLDTKIYPIIENKTSLKNQKNYKKLNEITFKDLLTHTTGYRDLLLFSSDLKNKDLNSLTNYLINYPIYYKPGDYFLYSNAGYYLLSVAMEEYLGYDLIDFANEELFKPLDIENVSWQKYGDYLAGATKLYLSADDMMNLGKLILNKGKFGGREVISSSYIEMMKDNYELNNSEIKNQYISEDYYGLGIWKSKTGIVFASGTGGQLIVVLDDLDIVIVSTNNGKANKSYKIKEDVDIIIKKLYESRG